MTVDLYAEVKDGVVQHVMLYCQGVGYQATAQTTVNGMQKFTFNLPVIADESEALEVRVEETVRVIERLGG